MEFMSAPHALSLTLLTADAGFVRHNRRVLTSWGMNIVKAEAFANTAGMVLTPFTSTRFLSHL